ncbi:MAG: VWA domain-containing protein [Desulfomonile tiedjei]|nr:VWA domain-containing protein [Desulfomonile tiedjei]
MKNALIDFVGKLRQAGISVSQAETMDAASCLQRLNLDDRSQFKDALRSSLVKRSRDIPVFEVLFDLYFSGGPLVGTPADGTVGEHIGQVHRMLAEIEERHNGELSPVTRMVMTGSFGELMRHLLAASGGLALRRMDLAPVRGRFFVNELRRMIDPERVRTEAEAVLSEMAYRGMDRDAVLEFREYVARNLERLEEELEELVLEEVEKSRFMALRRIEDEEIAERNLYQLTERDLSAMRPAVERLARRLKDRLSLRLRRADRGHIDIKRTLRGNVGYGGPLPDLRFRNKRAARPQVAALCDVSRSVRDFSRFMLLFLYTLKEVISRIRSFIFVGDLTEVTSIFREHDLNEAVSKAAAGQGLRYPFGTDYGSSLGQFVEEHLGEVNSKTTVIILGDARNNNLPPRIEALEAVAERARKVIWINPEPVAFWGTGDSVMPLYEPYCTTLAQCSNLAQLSDAIEENLIPLQFHDKKRSTRGGRF